MYATLRDWDELSTEQRVTGLVGGGSSAVAGIALGTMVYENCDSITGALGDANDKVVDGFNAAKDAVGDAEDKVVDGVKDFATDPGGSIKKGISGLFGG